MHLRLRSDHFYIAVYRYRCILSNDTQSAINNSWFRTPLYGSARLVLRRRFRSATNDDLRLGTWPELAALPNAICGAVTSSWTAWNSARWRHLPLSGTATDDVTNKSVHFRCRSQSTGCTWLLERAGTQWLIHIEALSFDELLWNRKLCIWSC